MGENFRCKYELNNGTEAFFIAEQVSHHPPISAFYYGSPDNGIYIHGDVCPKSRFLGNSAATLMEGENHIIFTHLHNERYDITMPNMYASGLLGITVVMYQHSVTNKHYFTYICIVGKMVLELGDSCYIRCKSSDLICELSFKTKVITKLNIGNSLFNGLAN